jgi:enolase
MSTMIEGLLAWEALDSRGTPTVGCEVVLVGGARGRATVPSGASTGTFEAVELRDGDARYRGRGVRRAVANVTGELAAAVIGTDAADQRGLDALLRSADGTPDLSRLGANAVLAISIAAAVAVAAERRLPLWRSVADGAVPLLPLPMVNIVSGGAHAGRSIDVQDFLAVPVGATSFAEAIEWAARTRDGAAAAMEQRGFGAALVADEGGLSAALPSNRSALELLVEGVERAGLRPGDDVAIAIDVAATQLGAVDLGYELASEGRHLTASELVDELAAWCSSYPIVSIEDCLGEDDWDGWVEATRRLAGRQLLGDDLFVTNRARVERGVAVGAANAVLVKPNQIGTLTDARDVVGLAHANGYATVLSARSGETEDDWLADLAVGWRTGQIKVGSTMRSERTAKWNRLIRLEQELGDAAVYAGASALERPVA